MLLLLLAHDQGVPLPVDDGAVLGRGDLGESLQGSGVLACGWVLLRLSVVQVEHVLRLHHHLLRDRFHRSGLLAADAYHNLPRCVFLYRILIRSQRNIVGRVQPILIRGIRYHIPQIIAVLSTTHILSTEKIEHRVDLNKFFPGRDQQIPLLIIQEELLWEEEDPLYHKLILVVPDAQQGLVLTFSRYSILKCPRLRRVFGELGQILEGLFLGVLFLVL